MSTTEPLSALDTPKSPTGQREAGLGLTKQPKKARWSSPTEARFASGLVKELIVGEVDSAELNIGQWVAAGETPELEDKTEAELDARRAAADTVRQLEEELARKTKKVEEELDHASRSYAHVHPHFLVHATVCTAAGHGSCSLRSDRASSAQLWSCGA